MCFQLCGNSLINIISCFNTIHYVPVLSEVHKRNAPEPALQMCLYYNKLKILGFWTVSRTKQNI